MVAIKNRPRRHTSQRATRRMARNSSSIRVGARGPGGTTGAAERAVVVTVTVAFAACEPSSAILEGEIEHVASAGAPEQVNETDWLNPLMGATPKLYIAV